VAAATGPAAEVLALEQKIEAATVKRDTAFAETVLSSDFHFRHGDGWTRGEKTGGIEDDRAAYLKRIADKEYLVHDLDGTKIENKIAYPWLGVTKVDYEVPKLHNVVEKVPPVAAKPSKEKAVYTLNWLSATGSGILIAAIIAGLLMGYSIPGLLRQYWDTIKLVKLSLLTIAAMLALGFVTRYSGTDATMGLAFAHTGVLYPFFGTLLGWLGVALTGSDTSSNVLFGGLQKVTAEQLGLSPILMTSANSSGGVMGKMIDAQSIVVASTATRWYGHEGDILRYVFFHSIALAALVGLLVTAQAYLPPFTELVVHPPAP
jgi:lactate permease